MKDRRDHLKGARAEGGYHLQGVLPGCAVNSFTSVTVGGALQYVNITGLPVY